ncbi:hypothetical protein [Pseudoxanthomonas sp. 10H]|uniref:hypothetical protein n=1 Tax=Pseudoxanthomonas sp. 10H TaxID=3242729 RepID=UPI0035584AA3
MSRTRRGDRLPQARRNIDRRPLATARLKLAMGAGLAVLAPLTQAGAAAAAALMWWPVP